MTATETPAATATTPAPKGKPAIDANTCRWGGGRYGSPATAKACAHPRATGKQLCGAEGANHEKAYQQAAKARRAEKAGTAASASQKAKAAPKLQVVANDAPAEAGPTPARKSAPRPDRKPIARVPKSMAAMVLPTVTPAPSSND